MHAKAAVFDRKTIYVGSCNLNLRSGYLNTVVGMFVDSPELAEELSGQIEVNMKSKNSWRQVLKNDNVVWITETGGTEEVLTSEP